MLWTFFLTVLGVGSLTFGGGYAMISVLQYDLVQRFGWLTAEEYNSGVAIGQVTPGPLMIMIAFMGYRIAGLAGALLGTVALFLPSFVAVLVVMGIYDRMRGVSFISGVLKAINLAVVGILAAVVWDMARSSVTTLPAGVLALGAFAVARFTKLDPVFVIAGSALAGFLLWR